MIRRILIFSVAFVILTTLTTCQKDHMLDCFKSAGDEMTETRQAVEITSIQLDDNVDLIIHPNSAPYIKVTAGENLIDGIITELDGNKLYIRNENRCNWMRSFKNTYTVEVGMDKPASVVYYGSGDINCMDTIRTNEFNFDCTNGSGSINFITNTNTLNIRNHTGRTDIHLKGKSQSTFIYINDVATCESLDLQSSKVYVTTKSTGDIQVNAIDELDVQILYNGSILYSGNPIVTHQVISGSGHLIRL
jgi:hypothetical protein